MQYKNRIINFFLLAIIACAGFACQSQQSAPTGSTPNAPVVKAQSPTEAYKLLYAACKAKDIAQIKGLMSKSSLGLAEFNASQQKQPVDKVLENGFLAPTLEPALTEIRDERIKDNFGRIEVRNQRENRWEDLPFVLEDGGWKVAVGDIFQGSFDPNQTLPKGKGQAAMEASNTSIPANTTNLPQRDGNRATKNPPAPDGIKSVEVPKEKPKMISAKQIEEIIRQYEKHGWSLRRVLLSERAAADFPVSISGRAEMVFSTALDALWFSRAAGEGRETWELRNLSGAPFALLEVFEDEDEEEIREQTREELQTRLLEQASKFVGTKGAA